MKQNHRTAIINGSWDMWQRPQHWMEKIWITRIVFTLYHKVRNWIITCRKIKAIWKNQDGGEVTKH